VPHSTPPPNPFPFLSERLSISPPAKPLCRPLQPRIFPAELLLRETLASGLPAGVEDDDVRPRAASPGPPPTSPTAPVRLLVVRSGESCPSCLLHGHGGAAAEGAGEAA
jgi:hypothetical protein